MTPNFRLGLFILTSLAIVSVGVFLVGRQETKFGSNYRVRSEFRNVAGLNEGADVRVGGIHKGTVRSIQLPKRPDGPIIVSMDLAKETQAIIKKDSVASIQSQGLLGDKYVEISFGSVDAEKLKGGDTIESQAPLDMSDLFHKANQLLDTGQGALESIQGAGDNLNQITAKVNGGQGTVGKLVNDNTLYQQATAGVTALHDDAAALQHNFLLRGFFNNRGYSNPEEIKKHEIAQLPKQPVAQRFDLDPKNLFDKPDSAKLKNQKMLSAVGEYLQGHKFETAVIAATSSMKGDSEKDRTLTEARSYVVRKYLVDTFKLDDTRIKTIGLGKNAEAGPEGGLEILVYGERPAAATPAAVTKETAQK